MQGEWWWHPLNSQGAFRASSISWVNFQEGDIARTGVTLYWFLRGQENYCALNSHIILWPQIAGKMKWEHEQEVVCWRHRRERKGLWRSWFMQPSRQEWLEVKVLWGRNQKGKGFHKFLMRHNKHWYEEKRKKKNTERRLAGNLKQ